ncbi:MAG: DUF3151 domain-containing protein [Candidatus Dormibacteria bacterium]
MSSDYSPPRPLQGVPIAAHGQQIQAHLTVLPEEPQAALEALAGVLGGGDVHSTQTEVLKAVCASHPSYLDGWARLGQAAYLGGDYVAAYAYSRVGYHRGLDRLRRHGWGGTGQVRWSERTNRGFLRALHLLMAASAAIGEEDECDRCRQFLLDLDPTDQLEIAVLPRLERGNPLGSEQLP